MIGETIRRNGKIATLMKALKGYKCSVDRCDIYRGELYWAVTYGGSGIGGLKHPERVSVMCLDEAMKPKGDANAEV